MAESDMADAISPNHETTETPPEERVAILAIQVLVQGGTVVDVRPPPPPVPDDPAS